MCSHPSLFSELVLIFWLGGGLSEFFMMSSLYFGEGITFFSDHSFFGVLSFEENKTLDLTFREIIFFTAEGLRRLHVNCSSPCQDLLQWDQKTP